MKKFLLLFGSTLLLSAVGSASIVCPTATYDVYTTTVNSAGGCSITSGLGSTLFNNFGFVNTNAGGAVPLTGASVAVTPVSTPEVGFQFNLPLGAGFNQNADVTLSYNATAPVGSPFTSASLFQNGGFSGTGNATVKDLLCLGGTILGGCRGGISVGLQTVANSITTQETQRLTFTAPVTTVDVSKDIFTGSGGSGGTATISVAANTLTETRSAPPSTVPEPVTMMLMGTGLLALGVMRRRSRKA